jgi:hypothetical protein
MKKVMKFMFDGKEGFLSIVEKPTSYLALVQKNTEKIAAIRLTNTMVVSYELKPVDFQSVTAQVIDDEQIIREVYEQLARDNNLYFKQLDDSLCVVQIEKPAAR